MTVEANDVTLTEGEQHWRRQLVTFFGSVLNLLLAGAGVGLAVASGTKTARSRTLIAPLVWASIQAYVAGFPPPWAHQADGLYDIQTSRSGDGCRGRR